MLKFLKITSALGAAVLALNIADAKAADTYGSNAASSVVVAAEVVKEASKAAASQVSGRVSSVIGGAATVAELPALNTTIFALGRGDGRAAGNDERKMGVWANVGNTWIDKDETGSTADFDGTVLTASVGADYQVNEKLLAGVSIGYESQDIDTPFNNGKLEGTGYTVAPYIGYAFNDRLNIDALVGASMIDYDTNRQSGAVTGSTDAKRLFTSVNVNLGLLTKSGLSVGTSVGYLYTYEEQDAYSESDGTAVDKLIVHLGQVRTALNVSYTRKTNWGYINPFGSARAEYDHTANAPGSIDTSGTKGTDDPFGVNFKAGVAVGIGDNLKLTVAGESSEFRDNLEVYSVSGTVRYKVKF